MISENYKLYRKHKSELIEMVSEIIEHAPFNPDIFGTATQEEKEQYDRELHEYLESRKLEVENRLKEMGFGVHESN